jgi:signal transduction histidine kinase
MKEVSCRVFEIFLAELGRRGIEPASVCRGTGVSAATLADKNARVDWGQFRRVMANLGQVFTRDELATIGRTHIASPLLVPISLVARLLFNTREIYEYWCQPNGPGQQLFACVTAKCLVIDERHLVVEMFVQAGYEPCEEFYYTTIGGLASVPTILNLDFAEVEMARTTFGARYHVQIPPGGGRFASLRRTVTWPFTVRQAGRELRDANESLIRQYREIAAAQTSLSLHTRQLSVAHRISEAMLRALDLERTLETVAASLAEVAGFAHVTIECDVVDEQGAHTLAKSAGERAAGEADLAMEFAQSPEVSAARLRLWIPAGAARTEYEELADFLRPTIVIALENARTLHALRSSRQQLDQRVKELTHAYGLVEQASIVKSQFVTNVSHELRTPMNGVLGMTALLRETPLNRDQAGYLEMLEQSGQNLLRIINDVLDFSRLESGTLQLESATFDLAGTVEDVVRAAAERAFEKGLDVALDVPRDLPARLRGDATRVSQLVSALVGNAVKFTERGGVTVSLSVRERHAPRAVVRVEVADTGIGVAADKVAALFQPFTQGDGSLTRRFEGTGLGLSIARRLAEMMGTTIEVASEAGAGSRFWCDLSLELAPGAEAPAPPAYEGLRVLLFDQAPLSGRLGEAALRAAGMEVQYLADPAALGARADQGWEPFDVVVLGEALDAPDAARPALASGAPPRAKTVFLRDPRARASTRPSSRADASVARPLRTDRLVEAVAAAAARQRVAEPAAGAELGAERAIIWEPEVLTERILIQLLKKRGVTAVAAASIADLARQSAREPAALLFTSLSTSNPADQRELEQLLHRLDLEPGGRRVVAMVSDRGEVPPGHVQRFVAITSRPVRIDVIDGVLEEWRRRPGVGGGMRVPAAS